jgi:ribonuclease-3
LIVRELGQRIEEARQPGYFGRDHKSRLQERLQGLSCPLPLYRVVVESGPEHRKTFSVQVMTGDRILANAEGRTKKDAEQEAARLALEVLKQEIDD